MKDLRSALSTSCLGVALAMCLLQGCANQKQPKGGPHTFTLVGGHFYGPGPIVPDTPLPTGYLRNIWFDTDRFYGYAEFHNDGASNGVLSDGKTLINQNIDAGHLDVGGGSNPVLLTAVKGGKNKGREYYRLNDDYSLVWSVDIALDPGFAEGIIRVDNFQLTTGLIKVEQSIQSQNNIPGGYDQAGSLRSGEYLIGRLGDFNHDGYMDGIVVAAPRVPLESAMLPGAPVGNQRGFETDVPLSPSLACELTLRSILQFREPVAETVSNGDFPQLAKLLKDVRERMLVAQKNMDTAILSGPWSPAAIKQQGFSLSDRLETAKTLNFIAIAQVDHYPTYGKVASLSLLDAMEKMFSEVESLVDKVGQTNKAAGNTLPAVTKI